MGMSMNSANDG